MCKVEKLGPYLSYIPTYLVSEQTYQLRPLISSLREDLDLAASLSVNISLILFKIKNYELKSNKLTLAFTCQMTPVQETVKLQYIYHLFLTCRVEGQMSRIVKCYIAMDISRLSGFLGPELHTALHTAVHTYFSSCAHSSPSGLSN